MVRHLNASLAMAVVAVALIVTPSFSQEGMTGQEQQKTQLMEQGKDIQQQSATGQDKKSMELKGKIVDQQDVKLGGNVQLANKVVLFETDDGRRIAADLGPSEELKDAGIAAGTEAELDGVVTSIRGKPVFMAREATINGRQHTINRQPITLKSRHEIDGEIVKMKDVRVKGQDQPHKVAILKTANGKQLYADLGPADNLDDLALLEGKKVMVKGYAYDANGRPVLLASQIESDGKKVSVKQVMKPGAVTGKIEGKPSTPGTGSELLQPGQPGGADETPAGSY